MRRLTSLAAAVAFGILLTFAGADARADGWGGHGPGGPGRGHHPHGRYGPGRGHHPHGGYGRGHGWGGYGPGYGYGYGYGPGYGWGGRGPFPPVRVYAVPSIYLGSPVGYIITYGGVRYRVIGGGSMVLY